MEIFVLRNGEQIGPFSEETVQSQLKRGGLLPTDKAWRKGLPEWVPLGEVMNPASSAPPPAPVESGVRSGATTKAPTQKQMALLKYLGATFDGEITYEEAAVAICKALESPKLTSRFAKWGDEKLRLHPQLFQDEMDYRRANRVSLYLDLCQGEGAKVVKDVTKAHVQVLIEALDKKNESWEVDSRAAFWDYFLPTIAEHFPQLVREEWKGKLKPGAKPKRVEPDEDDAVAIPHPPKSPGALEAAIRGIIYGLVVLGVALGTVKLYQYTKPEKKEARAVVAPVVPPPPAPVVPPFPVDPAPALAANPVGAVPPAGDNNTPVAPPAAPVIEPAPALPVPVPVAPEKPAGENPGVPALPPATPVTPEAPAVPAPVTPEPAPAPAAPAAPKTVLTITKSVTVQLQFGRVTLNPGTRVRFIATEGPNVRVNFNNNVILVPSAATDMDAPAPAAPVVAPAAPPVGQPSNSLPALPPASVPAGSRPTLPAVPSTAPSAIPTLPPVSPAPKPSSDL